MRRYRNYLSASAITSLIGWNVNRYSGGEKVALLSEDTSGILIEHVQPELRDLITLPRILTFTILLEVLLWIAYPGWAGSPLASLLAGLSLPIIAWLLVHRMVMLAVFTTPTPSLEPLKDPRWAPFRYSGWGGDVLTGHILEAEEGTDDLVIMIHGRGSSLARAESRAAHLVDLGVSVVGMNLRGHGGCDRRTDWTVLKVIEDLNAMMETLPHELSGRLPKRVWLYGHSLGGFLALWVAAEPKGWWKQRLAGVLLESPATSFPLAVESLIPTNARILMPWVRHVLRREHLRIHPDLSVRYATAQVPFFGMPDVPILVLQAARDDRLGRAHFNLLSRHLKETDTVFILDSQPHTSGVDSEERRVRLEEWLTPRIGVGVEGLI